MRNIEGTNAVEESSAAEEVRKQVEEIISIGQKAEASFQTGRKLTYAMIGALVRWVQVVLPDKALMAAALDLADKRGVPLPGADDNPMLMFVRLTFGKFHEDKWVPHRSAEHYAPVLRHFIGIETPPDEVEDILVEGREISDGQEKPKLIKATITNIKRADRELHPTAGRERAVFTGQAEARAQMLLPLGEVDINAIEEHLTFSEGFALVIVRKHEGKLQILGDSGKQGNDVLRIVKARTPALLEAKKTVPPEATNLKEMPLDVGRKEPTGTQKTKRHVAKALLSQEN